MTTLLRVERNKRSATDRRKKVDWWLFSEYRGAAEFRFAVETERGAPQPPAIRANSTLSQLSR